MFLTIWSLKEKNDGKMQRMGNFTSFLGVILIYCHRSKSFAICASSSFWVSSLLFSSFFFYFSPSFSMKCVFWHFLISNLEIFPILNKIQLNIIFLILEFQVLGKHFFTSLVRQLEYFVDFEFNRNVFDFR